MGIDDWGNFLLVIMASMGLGGLGYLRGKYGSLWKRVSHTYVSPQRKLISMKPGPDGLSVIVIEERRPGENSWRYAYMGSGTVWHTCPGGVRCNSLRERELCDIEFRERNKGIDNGQKDKTYV